MKSVVTHLMAPKNSTKTLNSLATLAGSFLGAKISAGLGNSNWLNILRGRETAPQPVLKTAELISSFKDNRTVVEGIISAGLGALQAKGLEKTDILAMAKSYAPVLDVELIHADVTSLTDALIVISERIIENDDTVVFTAAIDCPKCRYMFMV